MEALEEPNHSPQPQQTAADEPAIRRSQHEPLLPFICTNREWLTESGPNTSDAKRMKQHLDVQPLTPLLTP